MGLTRAAPAEAAGFRAGFRVLETIAAAARKPPNLHPAVIWTSADGAVPLQADGAVRAVPVPHVPGAVLLANVLGADTCRRIVGAAETLGFAPDQAAAGSAAAQASVLAHNFYWLADGAFADALLARVRPHLPPALAGRPLRALNRRFRCYRYVPGAVYRVSPPPSPARCAERC